MFANDEAAIGRLSPLSINFKNFLLYLIKVLGYCSPSLVLIFEDLKGVIIRSKV